jgi:branched-chain amino acid transport system permease protein
MELFITLTTNGLATGMLIFLLAAGLSLIFGLMSVLNFAHGGLFAWGAYVGTWVYMNTGSFLVGIVAGILTGMLLGLIMERLIIQPVYGNHIQQILITLGVMIVLGELIKAVFSANPQGAPAPSWLSGSFEAGNIIFVKYRLFIIITGFIVLILLQYVLTKTKLGLIVRAGVMNKEMIQALGVNIKKVFLFVFMLGAGLAGLSGVLLGPYANVITPGIGMEYQMLAFVVVVIGGMGSIIGTGLSAIIVGLANAYIAYQWPQISMAVNMLIMIAILIIRPQGLFGAKEAHSR